jgi:hypothetical protein
MTKQSLRINLIAGSLMMLSGMHSSAWGQGRSAACTDRLLFGDYAFIVEGLVFPAPGVQVSVRGVAMTNFDGQGGLTQIDHVVIGGQTPAVDWTPGTGTFRVNSDCTGTMRINVPSTGDFVNLRIVVSGQGRTIYAVVTAPFSGPPRTVTSTATRRDY